MKRCEEWTGGGRGIRPHMCGRDAKWKTVFVGPYLRKGEIRHVCGIHKPRGGRRQYYVCTKL